MSFRIEEKLKINKSKIFRFLKWIKENNGEKLYPSRIINSLYLDNNNYSMFDHSIEGVTPRKKIRIRTYDNKDFFFNKLKYQKELKITSVEGRYKTSNIHKRPINDIFNGLHDSDYGKCFPVLNVIYERDYYLVNNIRITIDKNIIYKQIVNKFISNMSTIDKFNVVELKYNQKSQANYFNNLFPFERSRYSKYCRGIEFIRSGYCTEL
jgi:hypothetical protein|tara:strand:+ start:191 stop:817 length:627 start_codon:yes stop_codon:yes gene_type:complete